MLTKKEVIYVSNLARLELKDEEIDKFSVQLSDILEYIKKLNEIDTKNVEPMKHAVDINNAFREDKVTNKSYKDDILKNAPDRDNDYFKVPKII